ncbi:MAG: hypothetical protein ABI832_05255 [bacterium]
MNLLPPDQRHADGLLALFDRAESDETKRTLAYLLLAFARFPNVELEPESHGYMYSLRVREGSLWTFAFAPAQNWILAYVRPPEFDQGRISFSDLVAVLPHSQDREDRHLTVRLHNLLEAERFFKLVVDSR